MNNNSFLNKVNFISGLGLGSFWWNCTIMFHAPSLASDSFTTLEGRYAHPHKGRPTNENAALIWVFSKPGLTSPLPPGILELLEPFSEGYFFPKNFGGLFWSYITSYGKYPN